MYSSAYYCNLASNSIFALRKSFKCISIKKYRNEDIKSNLHKTKCNIGIGLN
jgi:hypothetical protein